MKTATVHLTETEILNAVDLIDLLAIAETSKVFIDCLQTIHESEENQVYYD